MYIIYKKIYNICSNRGFSFKNYNIHERNKNTFYLSDLNILNIILGILFILYDNNINTEELHKIILA